MGRGLVDEVLSDFVCCGCVIDSERQWDSGQTYGIEAFGSLSVDCHDFDMVPKSHSCFPPLELLTSSPEKSRGRKTRARLSLTTPVRLRQGWQLRIHCRQIRQTYTVSCVDNLWTAFCRISQDGINLNHTSIHRRLCEQFQDLAC